MGICRSESEPTSPPVPHSRSCLFFPILCWFAIHWLPCSWYQYYKESKPGNRKGVIQLLIESWHCAETDNFMGKGFILGTRQDFQWPHLSLETQETLVGLLASWFLVPAGLHGQGGRTCLLLLPMCTSLEN